MNRDRLRQVVNVAALVLTLAVNWAANGLPLNGRNTAQISDSFEVLFVPAGYVFAIWGLIYALLIGYVAYQALPAQRENPRLRRVGYLFALSCLLNAAWLFAWHYGYVPLSLLLMLSLLTTLIATYRRLDIGRPGGAGRERWLLDLPFSVYLGWISVATVANAAVTLVDAGWNGGDAGPVPWTLVMLAVGAALGLAMAWLRHDVAYVLVLVWAYLGIWVAQSATPPVAQTALLLALVLAVVAIWARWLGRRAPGPALVTTGPGA
jgi:hypothetical protein